MPGPPADLQIRSATPADAEAVARIYVEAANAGYGHLDRYRTLDAERIKTWTRELAAPLPHRWWVAVLEGAIVGVVGIRPSRDPVDPELGEVDTLAVDPPHWRDGIGRSLIEHALRYLADDGYGEAILWTMANYPRGARFYESIGWTLTGATRSGGMHVCYSHELPG